MKIDRVLIFTPSFEQRVSKQVYSFLKRGIKTVVYAEEAAVSAEFENYINGVIYKTIPVNDRLKRTPLGRERIQFIRRELKEWLGKDDGKTIVISRDVNYGYIVGRILRTLPENTYYYITDVADNYDLFYDAYTSVIKRIVFKIGFGYLTKHAFDYSNAIYIVAGINKSRILNKFPNEIKEKPIFLLRNLPINVNPIKNTNKISNSMVYVGKIDEIARDPFYVLQKMIQLTDYSLHFYSDQKTQTISKMKKFINENELHNRIIFHSRVKYDELAQEISKYCIGLVPHKRGLLTDYTIPNKIYDYKCSGVVTVMCDCPALIEENIELKFGIVYSKAKDDFVDTIKSASLITMDHESIIPKWDEEFEESFQVLTEKIAIE